MTANQEKFPLIVGSFFFNQYGKSGIWMSELFPNLSSVADEMCMIHTLHTEAINHDPAPVYADRSTDRQ